MEKGTNIMTENDWFIEETNEPVIVNGFALRDIKEGETIVTYGKIAFVEKGA